MADNDQYDDEYQFGDLDTGSPKPPEEDIYSPSMEGSESRAGVAAPRNVKRNAIIAIAFIILAMVIYKFLDSFFSVKKETVKTTQQPTQALKQPPAPPRPTVVQPIATTQPTVDTPQVTQKLSAMEVSQQTLRSDVSTISNQMTSMSSTVNQMASQIAQLNQLISTLNDKIEEQSQDIQRLRVKPKPVRKVVRRVVKPITKCYVQALIPGRAWLICTNGATLTVREGSTIPGYGLVKLIDPHQGRVMTSSGQIIRFSQDDS
ncbi:type IVB secretion system protein IcmG/DotF [Legionella impletisoli]|uniref:Type IV secretion system protein IcmG n=1 Tax=Legionella impletisoli TaxID=343510 RepID=A0A917JWJ8_9GAMM|nr:type IVB secretion system protein IcmG/DotF [Legionella impletisoli]GGI89892.1 type IV secretion system protein IcmG [Legionella impletisoli]